MSSYKTFNGLSTLILDSPSQRSRTRLVTSLGRGIEMKRLRGNTLDIVFSNIRIRSCTNGTN